jgi:hypothetical protein
VTAGLVASSPTTMRSGCAVELRVAERRDHEHTRALDLPSEDADRVERRLVGPVDVLEDDDQRPRRCAVEKRGDDLVGAAVRELGQGRERMRREQRLALARPDLGVRLLVAEAPDDRCLPDTRLAGKEHEAAAPIDRLRQQGRKPVEELLPFEEGLGDRNTHQCMVARPRLRFKPGYDRRSERRSERGDRREQHGARAAD